MTSSTGLLAGLAVGCGGSPNGSTNGSTNSSTNSSTNGSTTGPASGPGDSGGSVRADGDELRVFVYAGGHEQTMREVFVPRFEQETGARVSLFAGWWDGIPKLKTAPSDAPPFDLMITDATQGYPAARDGLFAEINLDNVPNHRALAPRSLEHWVFEKRLGLLYPDAVMTLAYRRSDQVDALAGWGDLLAGRFDRQLGFYNSFYMSLFTFAAMLADSQGQAGSAHALIAGQMDEVFRFASEQRKRVSFWWPTTTEMILALNEATVQAGNMHSPDYLQVLPDRPDLAAVVPEHDRAMVQVFWAIPAGTSRQPLAEKAIDLLFSDDIQYEFAKRGMATSRVDTAARMAAENPLWKSLYPHTDEQFERLTYYPYDVYAEHWDELADRWDRTILRAG